MPELPRRFLLCHLGPLFHNGRLFCGHLFVARGEYVFKLPTRSIPNYFRLFELSELQRRNCFHRIRGGDIGYLL